MNAPKTVAAIVTEYRKNSHADVIVGKILEGFDQKGGPGPDLKVASMYVDQYPEKDMARDLAKKHGYKIFDTIEGAVTLGGTKVAVDGVLQKITLRACAEALPYVDRILVHAQD